jgi:hypothetical protein
LEPSSIKRVSLFSNVDHMIRSVNALCGVKTIQVKRLEMDAQ